MSDDTKLTKTTLPVPHTGIEKEGGGVRPEEDTDWKLAFKVLTLMVAGGFIGSSEFARYVEGIRKYAGDEAANFMVEVFNRGRSKWMQDFMG